MDRELTGRAALPPKRATGVGYNQKIDVCDGDRDRRMSGELAAAAAVTLVTAAMAGTVGKQWRSRRRPYQAAWLTALTMAALAAGCYVLFLLTGRPAVLFRLYYLFGAALNVAFLGLGSLYLFFRRSLRQLVMGLIIFSIVTASAIFAAPVDPAQLAAATGAGTHVLATGPWLPLLILLNTFGTVCLVGVALLSAWRTWQRREHPERAVANVVIAVGALTIAAAGAFARLGGAGAFWVIMLTGWVIMFAGFTATTRVPVAAAIRDQGAAGRGPPRSTVVGQPQPSGNGRPES
jgi:MFS family permease